MQLMNCIPLNLALLGTLLYVLKALYVNKWRWRCLFLFCLQGVWHRSISLMHILPHTGYYTCYYFQKKTTTKSAHVPVAYKIYFTAYLSVNIQNLLSLHTCLSKESIFYLLIIISFVLRCRCYGLPQYEHMVLIFMQAEKELNPWVSCAPCLTV